MNLLKIHKKLFFIVASAIILTEFCAVAAVKKINFTALLGKLKNSTDTILELRKNGKKIDTVYPLQTLSRLSIQLTPYTYTSDDLFPKEIAYANKDMITMWDPKSKEETVISIRVEQEDSKMYVTVGLHAPGIPSAYAYAKEEIEEDISDYSSVDILINMDLRRKLNEKLPFSASRIDIFPSAR